MARALIEEDRGRVGRGGCKVSRFPFICWPRGISSSYSVTGLMASGVCSGVIGKDSTEDRSDRTPDVRLIVWTELTDAVREDRVVA
jgi:hypothetical protein